MHPFVHRKDVPIKDYSRRFKHLQGGQRIFLKKFSRFCGAFYSFVNFATHSIPFCMSKKVDMSSPMTGRRNRIAFSH